MADVDKNIIVWFDGRFVPLAEARVSILTHALNYGTGIFEGIRGYWEEPQQELFLVRAEEHYIRWKQNCHILRIAVPPSPRELCELTAALCQRNNFRSHVYARPLAYKASARIGVHWDDNDAWAIVVAPFGIYLDSSHGLHAGVVSWRRLPDAALPGRGKICGAYVNSALAGDEARRNGFDEAIFLTDDGYVAEGASCNIFMLRKGRLITPPVTENIVEGITRASVIELAQRELGIEVVERRINRSELYVCDELFFTGTAVEVGPITRVDHRPVGAGAVGPVTAALQRLYSDATRGRLPSYRHWLQPVYEPALVGAR